MNTDSNFCLTCETFETKRDGDVAWLCFSENLMIHATDLNARDRVLDYLDFISNNDEIKVLIVMGAADKSGREEYIKFYQMVQDSKLTQDSIQRMINVLNQVILTIVELEKFVIHANSGKVISPFMNIGLACDYRIIADNTVYQNPNIELGLVPKGGGAYFLSKMIGTAKAMDVLLAEEDITANEALTLGIVNRVVPRAALEQETLKTAQRFAKYPTTALAGVKQLVNFSFRDLGELMELENQILTKTARSRSFWENIKNFQ